MAGTVARLVRQKKCRQAVADAEGIVSRFKQAQTLLKTQTVVRFTSPVALTGRSHTAIIGVDLPGGRRCYAQSHDPALVDQCSIGDPVGLSVRVKHHDDINVMLAH